MRSKVVKQLLKKELLDVIRDRKAIIMLILVPLLIYPLIMFGSFAIMTMVQSNMEQAEYKVVLNVDDGGALADQIMISNDEKKKNAKEDKTVDYLKIVDINELSYDLADIDKALQKEEVDVYVTSEVGEDGRLVYTTKYVSSITDSDYAEVLVKDVLDELTLAEMKQTIEDAGMDSERVIHPFEIKRTNIATKEQSAGSLLGTVLPFMLVISLLMGTMYPAIDATAGEKERGTLETLLTLPARNHEIIIAKFLTVALMGIISALLNMISMGLMIFYMMKLVNSKAAGGLGLNMSGFRVSTFIPAMLVTVIGVFAFSLFISAVTMCITALSKSYKEANNYITPLTLVVMLTAYIGFIPNVQLTDKMALVPVANICLLIKNLLLFKAELGAVAIVLLSNVIYAILAILFLGKIYDSENILFDEGKGNIQIFQKRSNMKKGGVPTAGDTWFIISLVLILYIYIGSLIQADYGIWGIFGSQILIVSVPLLYAIYTKKSLKKTFHLKLCKPLAYVAGFILFLGVFLLENKLSNILYQLFPEEFSSTNSGLTDVLMGQGKLVTYMIVAFAPAICEEMLFRGFVFSGFKNSYKKWTAIIISAIIFGVFHTSLIRLIPTAILGGVFAYLVYSTGSLFSSMICHCLNNGIYVFEMFHPGALERHLPFIFGENQGTLQIILVAMLGLVLMVIGKLLLDVSLKKKANTKVSKESV